MRTLHRFHEERSKLASPTKVEERLSIGHSGAVITGLSVLSWGIVILAVVALRAMI
jgi:hypothetical protein